jgi:uncharacterized membrane-anchored protein
MRKKLTHALAIAFAMLIAAPAFADGPGDAGPDVAAPPVRAQPITPPSNAAALEGRTGAIALDDIVLNVPAGYKFYPASEALAYLQRNDAATPPGAVLGLVARDGADVRRPGVWATVVSYDAIGYVPGETASGLADANFESVVRDARVLQNRPFEGFAMQPAFEPAVPNVTWSERAARPGAQGADLRHEVKSLGRYGVAGLTTIGSADQMGEIIVASGALQSMLSFPETRRHADFQAASDQVSAYSVPGLVTGVAAQPAAAATTTDGGQTGFGGLAGWFPWIAVGAIGLAIAGYMLMRSRRRDEDEA